MSSEQTTKDWLADVRGKLNSLAAECLMSGAEAGDQRHNSRSNDQRLVADTRRAVFSEIGDRVREIVDALPETVSVEGVLDEIAEEWRGFQRDHERNGDQQAVYRSEDKSAPLSRERVEEAELAEKHLALANGNAKREHDRAESAERRLKEAWEVLASLASPVGRARVYLDPELSAVDAISAAAELDEVAAEIGNLRAALTNHSEPVEAGVEEVAANVLTADEARLVARTLDQLNLDASSFALAKRLAAFSDESEIDPFTHCVGCGEPNGSTPDCDLCGLFREEAASEGAILPDGCRIPPRDIDAAIADAPPVSDPEAADPREES